MNLSNPPWQRAGFCLKFVVVIIIVGFVLEIRITADILENETGDLLLAFHALENVPEAPCFTIKNDDGVLYRNSKQTVVIGKIHTAIKQKLLEAKNILVTEVGTKGVVNAYFATIKVIN